MFDAGVENRSNREKRKTHHHKTHKHDGLAAEAVDKCDGDESREHIREADNDGSPHLFGSGFEARHAKNTRRVIHDDIDAGELLADLQANAEEHRFAEVSIFEEQAPALLGNLCALLDFSDFRSDFGVIEVQLLENNGGFFPHAVQHEPAGAFRQKEHAKKHHQGRQRDHAEHQSPGFVARGHREDK